MLRERGAGAAGVTFELGQGVQLCLAALAAELRRALRALLPLCLAHRFPGEAVHFLRGRDGGGAGNWCGRRRRRHLGDPGARRLPRRLAREIGGARGPARRACAPASRAPAAPPSRSASCSSPDSASQPHPRAARPPPGAGGGEGGGARAAQVADARRRGRAEASPKFGRLGRARGCGRRARLAAPWRAEPRQVLSGCCPRRPPGREPPPGALPSRVRAGCRRALVLLSALAPHRPGRPPAPRSLESRPRSASRAHRPPTEHARGSNCYNLRGWLVRARGDSVRVRARSRGPGEVLAGGGGRSLTDNFRGVPLASRVSGGGRGGKACQFPRPIAGLSGRRGGGVASRMSIKSP